MSDIDTLDFIAGDYVEKPLAFEANGEPYDLTKYTEFKCQWRVTDDKTEKIDITVNHDNASQGKLVLIFPAETTRKMLGSGVLDIECKPGPTTIVRFNTTTIQDVTRV